MASDFSLIRRFALLPLSWFKTAPFKSFFSSLGVAGTIGLVSDTGGLQNMACQQNWFRPVCGVLSWQGVAGPQEQKLWDKVSKEQTCDGYRQYIREYGKGEFVISAIAHLGAARRHEEYSTKSQDMPLPLSFPMGMATGENEEAAKAKALKQAKEEFGKMQCTGFDGGEFTLKGFDIAPEKWDCTKSDGAFTCGFDGKIICHTEARTVKVTEDCSSEKPAN